MGLFRAILFIVVVQGFDEWCRPSTSSCHGRRQSFNVSKLLHLDFTAIAVEAADWDGDGDLDLIVARQTPRQTGQDIGSFHLLEQVGGTFEIQNGSRDPFQQITPQTNFWWKKAFAAADWDRDGDVDLLVQKDGFVHFLERLADGRLGHPQAFLETFDAESLGSMGQRALALGDFDQDGDQDLLLEGPDYGIRYFEHLADGNVSERTGMKHLFQGLRPFMNNPGVLQPVDWNGDGLLDLIVKNIGWDHGPTENLLFFEHTLDGSFMHRQGNFPHFSNQSFTSADWNGDGLQDMLVSNEDGSIQLVSSMLDSRFFERTKSESVFSAVRIEWSKIDPSLVDWNGDGLLDLVLTSPHKEYGTRVLEGSASGLHEVEPPPLEHTFEGLGHTKLLDVNGDGRTDAVGCVGGAGGCDVGVRPFSLVYFERLQNGSLQQKAGKANPFWKLNEGFSESGLGGDDFELADLDYDGDLDLVVCTDTSLLFFEQTSSEWLAREAIPVSLSGYKCALRAFDYNGDMQMDLLLGTDDRLLVLEGLGSFRLRELPQSENPFRDIELNCYLSIGLAIGDWNGDGIADVLVSEANPDWKGLRFFEKGFCTKRETCSGRGFCNPSLGKCECLSGYQFLDCSGCAADFYRAETRNIYSRSLDVLSSCEPCPGRSPSGTSNVCSTRGKCHDDDLARTESAQHGNGSCLCQEPFFGSNCELGGCPAGYEYVQRKHWTCVACQKGWYKQAVGNNVPCSPCQANRFMPVLGGASCLRCEDMWLRVQVNKEKTACTRAMVNVLAIPTAFILAAGFFVMLPYVSGLPLAVRDVRLGQEGVMVTTKVRHWMLSGKRKMHLRFEQTGHPLLDGQEFRVQIWNDIQFLLLDVKDDVALSKDIETSRGTGHLKHRDSVFGRGIMIPFSLWQVLLVAGLVGVVALAELEEMTGNFRLTLTEAAMLVLGALTAVLVHWRQQGKQQTGKLDLDLQDFAKRMQKLNPNPKASDRGASRALSASQLLDFYHSFQEHILNRNMYYLCSNIVQPLTKPWQLSYADVVGPSKMQWFVSHYWGTPFAHFVETIRKHAEGSLGARVTELRSVTYWICTFSNNQWRVQEELGETWEFSSFYLALRSAGYRGTVMVLDEAVRPLTRSWCLFELLQTATLSREKKLQGLFLGTPSGIMNLGQCNMDLAFTISQKLSSLKLQDASASSLEDKKMIDDLVRAQPGGFDQVNKFLIQAVSEALDATQTRFQADLATLQKGLSAYICAEKTEPD